MKLKELREEMGLSEKKKASVHRGNIMFALNCPLPKGYAVKFMEATESRGISKSSWVGEAIIEKLKKEEGK